jgi:hypothetical protein
MIGPAAVSRSMCEEQTEHASPRPPRSIETISIGLLRPSRSTNESSYDPCHRDPENDQRATVSRFARAFSLQAPPIPFPTRDSSIIALLGRNYRLPTNTPCPRKGWGSTLRPSTTIAIAITIPSSPSQFPSSTPARSLFLAVLLASVPRRPLGRGQMNALEPIEPQLAQRPRDRKRKSEVSRCGCVEERSRGLQNSVRIVEQSDQPRVHVRARLGLSFEFEVKKDGGLTI